MRENTKLGKKLESITEMLVLQKALDALILEKNDVQLSKKAILTNKFASLFVEVGEFANASRCFKYWSKKKPESRERLLDEAADVLHFFLSICNDMEFTAQDIYEAYLKKNAENIERQNNGY